MSTLSSRRLRAALWTIAAGATVAAAMLWVVPVRMPPPLPDAGAIGDSALVPGGVVALDPSVAEDIAIASVFLRARTPPSRRFEPVEGSGAGGSGMLLESNAMLPAEDSLQQAGDIPRLFGTMIDSSGPRALLHLDGAAGPRLYAVGEHDGGFRVLSIAPRTAVLAGPRGRVTLRLDPEEDHP